MSKKELLTTAPKAITHLRAQRSRRRLGLVFGSGASSDLGFPKWRELIQLIAEDPDVNGAELLTRFFPEHDGEHDRDPTPRSLASITQLLFNRFRDVAITAGKLAPPLTFLQEQHIKTDWLRTIHKKLYGNIVEAERTEAIRSHVYLGAFLDIVKHLPLTINYNFDDTLEKMLLDAS